MTLKEEKSRKEWKEWKEREGERDKKSRKKGKREKEREEERKKERRDDKGGRHMKKKLSLAAKVIHALTKNYTSLTQKNASPTIFSFSTFRLEIMQ